MDIGSLLATIGADITDLKSAVAQANSELEKYSRKTDDALSKVNRGWGSSSAFIVKSVGLIGTAFAGLQLKTFLQDVAMAGARYETLGVVLTQVGKNMGYSSQEMNKYAAGVKDAGIQMDIARQVTIRMAQAQIDLSKSQQLARIAQDAAIIGNINSSEALERMIHGIQTAQTDVLRSIGINVSFEASYAKLAKELGKTSNALTEQEKMQARTNAVMEEGVKKIGTYEAAMETAGKQITSLPRYINDFKIEMGEAFNPATADAVKAVTNLMKDLNTAIVQPEIQAELQRVSQEFANWVDNNSELIKQHLPELIQSIAVTLRGVAAAGQVAAAALSLVNTALDSVMVNSKAAGMVAGGQMSLAEFLTSSTNQMRQRVLDFDISLNGVNKTISESTDGYSEYAGTISGVVASAVKESIALTKKQISANESVAKLLAQLQISTGGYADAEKQLKYLEVDNWRKEKVKVIGATNEGIEETARLMKLLADQEEGFKNRYSNMALGMAWDDSFLTQEAQIAYLAEKELKAVEDRKKAEEDLAKFRERWAKEYKKSQEKSLEAYTDFSDTIKDNIKDIIESHENMADKIVSIFKDMLYEIAASIIAQKFVIPIGLQIGSALGATWNGTSFSNMSGASSNILSTASGANSIYNAFNGGTSQFLTTGLGGKVGSSIFGNSNWYGTGASMAGTSAAYYGGAEYMVAAGAEAAGTAGIASTLSAIAPYAAIAAIAIPLITSLFEDDPTPAIGIQGGSWEEESPSTGSLNSTKYNYKLFAQDMGGESSATLLEFFDTRFAAVDEALSGAFAETLEKYDAGAKNRGWVYTEGMDTDAILEAVSNNVFEGILDGLKTVTMGAGFESFGVDFFESIKGDDEDLFQAFIDFNTVVEGTTDFLEKFSGQMAALGDDSLQAFLNLESIMGVFTEMDAMMDPLIKITDPLVQIIDQFETWIDALNDSLATLEEVTEAEKNRTTALGMQVSGLTATNVSSALQQAIMGGDTGSLISDIMKQSVSSSLAVSLTNEVIEKYITPFNIKLGEVFDAVGGDVEKMFDYLPYIIDQLDISSIISEVDALSEKWDDFFDNAGIDIDSLTSSRNSAGQEYLSALESELSILEDKAATAKENYLSLLDDELSAQQDIVSALTPAIKSLQDFKSEMWSTAGTIGVTGKSIYASQMSSLASSAMSGDTESIDSLLSVSEKYLDTAKSTSVSWIDYARDLAKTSVLLTGVEDSAVDQLSEAEKQTEYLEGLMDEVNGVSSNVTDIAAARAAYESAQMELDNSWMQEEIATLKSLLDSSQTIEQLMQAFFAAQAALITAQTTADPEAAYLAANPDVAAAVAAGQFTSGQEHYDLYGKYEGRGATGYASLTKEDTYLANNLDVAQAVQSGQFASGLEHYLMYGLNEGRQFRDGGFISGPDSGYKMPDATFHGDEWIIPNKKLPDNDAVVKAIEKQTERLETLNYQTVKNTLETTKLLKRFNDVDAMKVRVIA